MQLLFSSASGSGTNIAWTVRRPATFQLGNYALTVQQGAAMTQASDVLGYGIAFDATSVLFIGPGAGFPATAGSVAVSFAGVTVGSWIAGISIPNQGDGLANLGVALRYGLSSDDSESGVTVITMPILKQHDVGFPLYLNFDPLNPLIAQRSNLAFFDANGTSTPPALDSYFVTALGYKTTLTPLAASAPLSSARLAFCATPLFATSSPNDSYFDYYLAPDGAFTIGVKHPQLPVNPTLDRLILGTSGLEYVGLPASGGAIAFFRAGQPAFMLKTVSSSVQSNTRLTSLATTSYVTFLPASAGTVGLSYYAQPRQSPLFTFATDLGPNFMDFLEIVAASLPAYTQGGPSPPVLPVGVYSGIDPQFATEAHLLEDMALAPARRALVGLPTTTTTANTNIPLAVTPQGLIATLTTDETQLTGVVIGNMTGADEPLLAFTDLGPKFRGALLANQTFFVVSNVIELMSSASVRYRLDPKTIPLLASQGVPPAVVTAINDLLSHQVPPYPIFEDEQSFVAAIDPVAHNDIGKILPIAGMLKANLDGWNFQLSPRSWRTDPSGPTIMLFKFCNRTLEEMVADTTTWGWPGAAKNASGNLRPTQQAIQEIFTTAKNAAAGTPYRNFFEDVVSNPSWNGVLFLNATVAIAELPKDLQFVTAGIDPGRFYAHHIGFSLTPFNVTQTALTLQQTAVFALIDYNDQYDLVLSESIDFAFKTLGLRARFANAHLADFATQVELMMNRLFEAELTKTEPERGNNLVVDGTYQRQNDRPSYSFALRGENIFDVARSALQSIEVLGLQLQTAIGTDAAQTVTTDFILTGNLRFIELENFDLFSYGRERFAPEGSELIDGYLRYGNLIIRMSFPLGTPMDQTFQAFEGQRLTFDLSNTKARPRALAQNFPLRVTGCIATSRPAAQNANSDGQKPEDLGYVSISAPISQTTLTPPWYGLTFDVDIGTLGALAGSAGLSLTLLAAWAPGLTDDAPSVYFGLRMPNGDPLSALLPIQGVMRLGFRSFQFQAHDDDPLQRKRSYMLRLRRLALSILGWSFPPGNADVFLFGNPDGSGRASLGWYGAYDGMSKNTQELVTRPVVGRPSTRAERRLLSGRRGLPSGEGI
jgi:hypothetical protein